MSGLASSVLLAGLAVPPYDAATGAATDAAAELERERTLRMASILGFSVVRGVPIPQSDPKHSALAIHVVLALARTSTLMSALSLTYARTKSGGLTQWAQWHGCQKQGSRGIDRLSACRFWCGQ